MGSFGIPVDVSSEVTRDQFLEEAKSFSSDGRFYRAHYYNFGHKSDSALSFKGFFTDFKLPNGNPIEVILKFNHATNDYTKWMSVKKSELSQKELSKIEKIEKQEAKQAAQKKETDDQLAREKDEKEVFSYPLAKEDNPYIVAKKVVLGGYEKERPAKNGGDKKILVIPLVDINGRHVSHIDIIPKALVDKFQDKEEYFPKNGKKNAKGVCQAGGFIPSSFPNILQSPLIFVAEGYATARTVEIATEMPCIGSASIGRFKHIKEIFIKHKYKGKLVFLPDADANGRAEVMAKEVVGGTNFSYILPKFKTTGSGTDWNDLSSAEGLQTVKEQLGGIVSTAKAIKSNKLNDHRIYIKGPNTETPYTISVLGWEGQNVLVHSTQINKGFTLSEKDLNIKTLLKVCPDVEAWESLIVTTGPNGRPVHDYTDLWIRFVGAANFAEKGKVYLKTRGLFPINEKEVALVLDDCVRFRGIDYNEDNLPPEVREKIRVVFKKELSNEAEIPPLTVEEFREVILHVRKLHFESRYHAVFYVGGILQGLLCGVLPFRPGIGIISPTQAGKTTLEELLRAFYDSFCLISPDQSIAGSRQALNNKALIVIHDEFDSKKDVKASEIKKASIIKNIRESFNAGFKIIRGSPFGLFRETYIDAAHFFFGTEALTLQEQEVNRIVHFTLNPQKKMSPEAFRIEKEYYAGLKKNHFDVRLAKYLTEIYPNFLELKVCIQEGIQSYNEEMKKSGRLGDIITDRGADILAQMLGLLAAAEGFVSPKKGIEIEKRGEKFPCVLTKEWTYSYLDNVATKGVARETFTVGSGHKKADRCLAAILDVQHKGYSVKYCFEQLTDIDREELTGADDDYKREKRRREFDLHAALNSIGIYFDPKRSLLCVQGGNESLRKLIEGVGVADYVGALREDPDLVNSYGQNTIKNYNDKGQEGRRLNKTGFWLNYTYESGTLSPIRRKHS